MKVTSVKVLAGYRLQLTFADGVKGEVDLSSKVGKGVFTTWKNPKAFESVRVGETGDVVWPEGIDLCPDSLYQQVTGRLPKEFASRNEPAHA